MNIKLKKAALQIAKGLGIIAFWIIIWFIIAKIANLDIIIPSPYSVWVAFTDLVVTESFWLATLFSFVRVILGLFLSFVIGALVACIIYKSKICDTLISPVLSIIKATPVASFIVIAWIWFDTSILPIFIASLIVIPIVTSNVLQGLRSVDKGLTEVAKVYRLSWGKKVFKLYIPSILPYFIAASSTSLGMAWKASVAAELIVLSQYSLGNEMYSVKLYTMEAAPIFALTIVVIILSIIIEKTFIYLLNIIAKAAHLLPKGDYDA